MLITKFLEDKMLTIDFNENENNKKWFIELDICDNPICHCEDMTLELYESENKKTVSPKHRISINALEKKAVKLMGKNPTSKEDFQLAKSFAKNLSEKDWQKIRDFFLGFKRKITESKPITKIRVSFPEKKIERDGLMMGYHQIFPYSEELRFELDGIEYLLDDQYCLCSTCDCTHAMVTFLPLTTKQSSHNYNDLLILYDYKTNTYQVENPGPKNIATPKELVKIISRKHYKQIFIKRHKQLRTLYDNFRNRKRKTLKQSDRSLPSTTNNESQTTKIGRNQPCPCGSGKKYKKCCM